MSKERSDKDYKPRHKPKGTRHTPCRTRKKFVRQPFQGYESDSGISTFVNVGSPEGLVRLAEGGSRKKVEKVDKMAHQENSQMEVMMEMFIKMREEDKRREEDRREERAERKRQDERREEERRKEEDRREEERVERRREEDRREERQQQLMLQLRESKPAVPQTVQITQNKLPTMTESDDLEAFVTQLEIAMKSVGLPRTKWKHHMLTQLTVAAKEPIVALLDDDLAGYEAVKDALLSRKITSHATAAEAYYSFNNRELLNLPLTQVVIKLKRWLIKMEEHAETEDLRREKYIMGHIRSQLVPDLKIFLDISKPKTAAEFEALVEQWSLSQPTTRPIYVSKSNYGTKSHMYGIGGQSSVKKSVTCFFCGKLGHMAKECRSRPGEMPKGNAASSKDVKPIVCFLCNEVGHKSPQCPNKKKEKVKKVKIFAHLIETLAKNDVMASVNNHLLPMTLDSGAEISIVPQEFVNPSDFTGESLKFKGVLAKHAWTEARVANVPITIGPESFQERVLAVPGEDLGWTAVLRFDCGDPEQLQRVGKMMEWKRALPEDQTQYVPPTKQEGLVKGAVLVSEWEVVVQEQGLTENVAQKDGSSTVSNHSSENNSYGVSQKVQVTDEATNVSGTQSPEVQVTDVERRDIVVGIGDEAVEMVLGEGVGLSSVLVEAGGNPGGGSAVDEGVRVASTHGESESHQTEPPPVTGGEVTVDTIMTNAPRDKLAKCTVSDPSLAIIRTLADKETECYVWKEGLVFRHRLDEWGQNYKQLCLPQQYRLRCLTLAHEKFGHRGRNKIIKDSRRLFHWPSLTSDVAKHCRSCDTCQRHTKSQQRVHPMQEREVVTVPSERVCIDIVGPFPKAKGGFQYLLTYIDMATRWPEAIPLRKTTTSIVITQLRNIFARNGFPTTLVSDNGPQFVSTQFEKFLKTNGIQHVKTSPYHPQGNGVVERLHGTLNSIVAKTTEKKGNWAEVVPMALYFVRCTPGASSGVSPFVLKHGWEPIPPLQLLYKGWVQQSLGDVDLEQWVLENAERVQNLRKKVTANYSECSRIRKEKWDGKAKERVFNVGELVMMRKSGMNTKLSETWLGPYKVIKVSSPLSYKIDTGSRKMNSVHIQLLKKYVEREDQAVVKRVTTVLEPDTEGDTMEHTYSEVVVTGNVQVQGRDKDIQEWLKEFEDIMTKEPGRTNLAEFAIDTGTSKPIAQRPYITPP